LPPTPRFLLRLPADLRAELERVAQAEHRPSLSNLIVHALREWLAGRGHVPPPSDQEQRSRPT
jgi:metal-responsive CopG/Arc/MetJ family transcriptional regulator